MTELKTLKDLKYSSHCSKCRIITIDPEELKQEAIKWVKFLDTKIITSGSPMWRSEFMDFFNLTEEDLR